MPHINHHISLGLSGYQWPNVTWFYDHWERKKGKKKKPSQLKSIESMLLLTIRPSALTNMVICENICDLKLVNMLINQNMRNSKQIEFILVPQLDGKTALVCEGYKKETQVKMVPKIYICK